MSTDHNTVESYQNGGQLTEQQNNDSGLPEVVIHQNSADIAQQPLGQQGGQGQQPAEEQPAWVNAWRDYVEKFDIFEWIYLRWQIHYTDCSILAIPVFLIMLFGLVAFATFLLMFVIAAVALRYETYGSLVMSFYIMIIVDNITFHISACIIAREKKYDLNGDFGELKLMILIRSVTTVLAFLSYGEITGIAGQICVWIYIATAFCLFVYGTWKSVRFFRYKI